MAETMTAAEFQATFAKGRKAGGKRAKSNGDAAEELILALCESYRRQGRARLRKVDPPSRVVGRGNAKRIIYLENPFLDLVGVWSEKGGRALFLEVKSTKSPRLPIARKDGVTEKQIESLKNWRDSGAVTGVLWVRGCDLKVITLETIEFAIACGHASLHWGGFPLCRSGNSPFLRYDFLAEIADE